MRIAKFKFEDNYEKRIGVITVTFAPSYDGEDMGKIHNRLLTDKYFRQQKFTDVMCKALSVVQPADDWASACRDATGDENKSGFVYTFDGAVVNDEFCMTAAFPI